MTSSGDKGVRSIALLCLASALAVLLSVGVPIVIAPEAIRISDWLGFAGAVVGIAGALLVGRIAVAPVWRQVNIMGAQAALQMYPLLQDELSEIDKDGAFLGRLWKFSHDLANLSARIEFWEGNRGKLAETLAAELINIRSSLKSLTENDWREFYDRLRLADGFRLERRSLRAELGRIEERSLALTRQQHTPPGMLRSAYIESIAESFISDVLKFVDGTSKSLWIDLSLHTARLAKERERLISKAAKLQKSIDLL